MTIEIRLPRPYALQREIMTHPAKRKVICAGRRGGKTVMAALLACENLLAGRQVLLSSTSQDQADVFWRYTTRWLAPLVTARMAKKNEVKRTITFLDGGMLTVKTGRDPDALRGAFADLLVLDECAYLDPTAWFEVGAPMLADRNGDAVFISTPKRRNWFFELYTKACDPNNELWHGWRFPSTANPHLNADGLAMLTADMTDRSYRQEILAEFVSDSGQVFPRIRDSVYGPAENAPADGGQYVIGVDLAKTVDFSVFTVVDIVRRRVVEIVRIQRQDYTMQIERLAGLHARYRAQAVIVETNNTGAPVIEQLYARGLPVVPFTTTNATKAAIINALVLAFEQGTVSIPDDETLINELNAFEIDVLPSGLSRYSAPEGLHDDMVMSLAFAWWGATQASGAVSWVS